MLAPPQASIARGVLLIADISGYTMFLEDSELDHAHGILTDLLSVMVDGTRPPFTISRLEGDAVFSYALDGGAISGETIVELIEATYIAFRSALEQMVMNTRCECRACANIARLNLKFIVHHGEFIVQQVGDHRELVGADVNLVHRLAKNSISDATGIEAYAVYTEQALDALAINHLRDGWVPHSEAYDLGTVDARVADMQPRWDMARQRNTVVIPEDEILASRTVDIGCSLEVVWDRLTHPDYRRMLIGSDRQELEGRRSRPRGTGDVYLCWHGDTVVTSEVLAWIPFEYLLTKDLIHVPGSTVYISVVYALEVRNGGVHLTMGAARPTGPRLGRAVLPSVLPKLMEAVEAALVQFRDRIENESISTEE